jgi:hypothetical protein
VFYRNPRTLGTGKKSDGRTRKTCADVSPPRDARCPFRLDRFGADPRSAFAQNRQPRNASSFCSRIYRHQEDSGAVHFVTRSPRNPVSASRPCSTCSGRLGWTGRFRLPGYLALGFWGEWTTTGASGGRMNRPFTLLPVHGTTHRSMSSRSHGGPSRAPRGTGSGRPRSAHRRRGQREG